MRLLNVLVSILQSKFFFTFFFFFSFLRDWSQDTKLMLYTTTEILDMVAWKHPHIHQHINRFCKKLRKRFMKCSGALKSVSLLPSAARMLNSTKAENFLMFCMCKLNFD